MTEQVSALQSAFNKDPRDIILKPVVSEKSYSLIDEGKYTFSTGHGLIAGSKGNEHLAVLIEERRCNRVCDSHPKYVAVDYRSNSKFLVIEFQSENRGVEWPGRLNHHRDPHLLAGLHVLKIAAQ